jgi:hypothetical protein
MNLLIMSDPNILVSTLSSNILKLRSFLNARDPLRLNTDINDILLNASPVSHIQKARDEAENCTTKFVTFALSSR